MDKWMGDEGWDARRFASDEIADDGFCVDGYNIYSRLNYALRSI